MLVSADLVVLLAGQCALAHIAGSLLSLSPPAWLHTCNGEHCRMGTCLGQKRWARDIATWMLWHEAARSTRDDLDVRRPALHSTSPQRSAISFGM